MTQRTRYQAAIVEDDHLLMLKVWDHAFSGKTFWVIPGGGREPGEAEEACVIREAWEETNLQVQVVRLVLEEPDMVEPVEGLVPLYDWTKTYLCRVEGGQAQPGLEPEIDADDLHSITALGWFDLRAPQSWDLLAVQERHTYGKLMRLRAALGYA